MNVPVVPVQNLHERLGFKEPLKYPASSLRKPLHQWRMEIDDAPIFRYLYRQFLPKRHLEFGTWQGTGTLYCLEECGATVWTINLPFGEMEADGRFAYKYYENEREDVRRWADRIGWPIDQVNRTDGIGFVGRYYLDKNLGHRVSQIYCDSTRWDTSAYPDGFFDSVLVDGGHLADVVCSDTQKALRLLRPGGLILWHDFCPDEEVQRQCASPRGVMDATRRNWDMLQSQTRDLFWIQPSWILLGIHK